MPQIIKSAKRYAEGTAVLIDVNGTEDVDVVKSKGGEPKLSPNDSVGTDLLHCADVHLTISDGRNREFYRAARIVTRLVLRAVIQFVGKVGCVIGMQYCRGSRIR